MRYMLLIYGEETNEPQPGTADGDQMFADYGTFTEELVKSGAMESGAPAEIQSRSLGNSGIASISQNA